MAKALHSRWLQLIIILSSTIFNKTTKLLNVGCGLKIAKNGNWTNIDMGTQSTANVIRCNLLNGFPFGDDEFDVVYHSQVLEHFPKDKSAYFIAECFRVLKPGRILRVVVPDLEDIAITYLDQLQALRTRPTQESEVRYDWILLKCMIKQFEIFQVAIWQSTCKILTEVRFLSLKTESEELAGQLSSQ